MSACKSLPAEPNREHTAGARVQGGSRRSRAAAAAAHPTCGWRAARHLRTPAEEEEGKEEGGGRRRGRGWNQGRGQDERGKREPVEARPPAPDVPRQHAAQRSLQRNA